MSKQRKLLNGKTVNEYDTPISLSIYTKSPEKWMLIDMQTGQKYTGSPEITQYGHWIRTDNMLEKCTFCEEIATFNQPSQDTGQIISVCKTHFIMSMPS